MRCPFCGTENREDRETCYHCEKDLTIVRLISNKARHHYNLALEHAERHRYYEAIKELQNALDLDSSMVEAHVVLGTIFARLNRPDEARRHWEQALNLSKPHQKAHAYLGELERIAPYRGALRRLRWIILGFAAAAVLCVALAAALFWPNPAARHLDRAWAAYREDHLSAAREALSRLGRPISDPALELSAQTLEFAMERDIQESLESLQVLLEKDRPLEAIAATRRFLERQPPPLIRAQAGSLLSRARDSALARVREHLDAVDESPPRLERARREVERFLETCPRDPEAPALRRRFAETALRHVALRRDSILSAYAGSRRTETARAALEALLADLDSLRAGLDKSAARAMDGLLREIETALQEITLDEAREFIAAIHEAMDREDFTAATERLAQLQALPGLPDAFQRKARSLAADLARRQDAALVENLREDLRERRWDAALLRAEALTTATLGAVAREEIERSLAQARSARAVEAYQWLMRRADDIEAGRFDSGEASEILRLARIVQADLSHDLYPAALDDACYFEARALDALGRAEESAAALKRLGELRPRSRWLAGAPAAEPEAASPAESDSPL